MLFSAIYWEGRICGIRIAIHGLFHSRIPTPLAAQKTGSGKADVDGVRGESASRRTNRRGRTTEY